nr:high light inducible protein [Prochlorococcus marinus]
MAEIHNCWAAMIGVVSGIGAFAINGKIIPGVF